ncbi:MAG: Transcriptional regulator, TetR family protein [Actinomycetia bacterium]|nr:Transcriptional regulator, TetR family protein [Actinomycetes bacterium]
MKEAHLTASIGRAIADRGTPELDARVTAQLGALALRTAYERWSDPGTTNGFSDIARQALGEVRAAVSATQTGVG